MPCRSCGSKRKTTASFSPKKTGVITVERRVQQILRNRGKR